MTAYVNLQNETWIFESINLQIDALEVDNNLAKEHDKQIQQVLTMFEAKPLESET